MEHTIQNGIYGEGDIWQFYDIEEAEQHKGNSSSWKYVVEQMKQCLGKIWLDKKDILYFYDDTPIYREYKIIGVEDNEPFCDYYWILEDQRHPRSRKYELVNSADFYKQIKQ